MKKWIRICLCLAVAAVVLCGILFAPRLSTALTWRRIQKQQDELEAFARELIINSSRDTKTTYKNWKVSYWAHTGSVEFEIAAFGLVPSSKYSGFYYSWHDCPLGAHGYAVTFTEQEDGWYWQERNGDNRQYTKRMAEHWFWYEMHY